ncbi:hypothetical protein DPEC_G00021480 [Dallia pectoralis]|uniref:Uncharacterized protein n=1 Tax=Dallia pectoralis TaxID=75939 RepID=A0ACC2HGJ8_DALPE|nr:hypothetical protein DPEC_G00021480 [Dallia pectoralis]
MTVNYSSSLSPCHFLSVPIDALASIFDRVPRMMDFQKPHHLRWRAYPEPEGISSQDPKSIVLNQHPLGLCKSRAASLRNGSDHDEWSPGTGPLNSGERNMGLKRWQWTPRVEEAELILSGLAGPYRRWKGERWERKSDVGLGGSRTGTNGGEQEERKETLVCFSRA